MAPSRSHYLAETLPMKVWFDIISHLDDKEVKNIKTVSREFRSFVLGWRFCSLTVDLDAVQNDKDYVGKRWRFLGAGGYDDVPRLLVFSRVPSSTHSHHVRPYNRNFKTARMIIELYIWVTSIDFFWGEEAHQDLSFYIAPFLAYAVAAHHDTLQSIRIGTISLDSVSYLLWSCPRISKLTRLEMMLPSFLNIDVKEAEEGHLYKDIATFINLHQNTLQTLIIRPKRTRCSCSGHTSSTFDVDLDMILRDVGYLKQLRNIYIQPGRSNDQCVLRGFLERHSSTLKRLTVHLPSFDSGAGQAVADLYTPALQIEHLTFDDETHNPASLGFVTRLSSKLTSLVISTRALDTSDWTMICGVQWPELQTLELTLQSATADTFDTIAAHFVSLLFLNLTVACDVMETEAFHAEFSREMERRCYSACPLRSVVISMPFFPKYCVDSIIRAFPAVVTVGHLSRETYLSHE